MDCTKYKFILHQLHTLNAWQAALVNDCIAYLHMTLCIFREEKWLEREGKVLEKYDKAAEQVPPTVEGMNLVLEKLDKE